MRDIGKNIKSIRQSHKITQEALAEMLYVSHQTISNYETGRTRPDIQMLVRISEVLDVEVTTLIYGNEKRTNHTYLLRAILGFVVAFVLAILYPTIWKYVYDLFLDFKTTLLYYWMQAFYCPILGLLIAWSSIQLLVFVKKLHAPAMMNYMAIRIGIIFCFVSYILIILPYLIPYTSLFPLFWKHIAFSILSLPSRGMPVTVITLAFFVCGLFLFSVHHIYQKNPVKKQKS